jgi:YHS domain-containing protein
MWKTFFMAMALLLVADDVSETPADDPDLVVQGAAQTRDDRVVPLEGLDPVLLTQGKEVQGDEQFAVARGRFRYLFAGAETKAAFEREPARYEIQLGGTCARMGPTVQGNPDLYYVHQGRIYIFGSPACAKTFKEAPGKYLEADTAAATPATDDALRRGRALVEKAVEAAGGASKVDGLVSYQEKGSVGAHTQQGVTEIKTALFMVYPDRVRQERTLPFGTVATVLAPAGNFFAAPRSTGDIIEEQRAALQKQFMLNPLAILRARREAGFKAAAVGASKVGEASVEAVDVSFGGVRARLGIDPATGRVVTLSYRGRGDTGAFGEIVQTFSDFRTVGGLTLPFKTVGTFDGEPAPAQTSTVESIVVNAEIASALFERPKPAGGQ